MSLTGRKPMKKRVRRHGNKTNIGVLIDADLWKRFRMHCLEHDESPGDLLSELIRKLLDDVEK